ncbi:MAG: hypothetical protein Ct9H300mP12_11080 [Acidimicrobiales bacterium]|nr:MAG: hypothetical protein Ct9H300mP12_11080 [Acidimicrobiales bacterium]
MFEALVEQGHPLLEVEQTATLGRVDEGRHHHLFEEARRRLDHLHMAIVDGGERTGV